MAYKTFTAQQLITSLQAQFPAVQNTHEITNQTYHRITKEWVDKVFAPYFREVLFARNKTTWRAKGNQCEHFAFRAMLAAVDCYDDTAQNDAEMVAESIAVSWIKFKIHNGVWHAINLWWIDGIWQPWEPQTQQWRPFIEQEHFSAHKPIVP